MPTDRKESMPDYPARGLAWLAIAIEVANYDHIGAALLMALSVMHFAMAGLLAYRNWLEGVK